MAGQEKETHPGAEETKCCQPVAEFQMWPKVEMTPYIALLGLKDKQACWAPEGHQIAMPYVLSPSC